MKLMGSIFILLAAAQGWLAARRRMLEPLRLGEALLEDLAVLKTRVCTGRMPLPRILEQELDRDLTAGALWLPLSRALKTGTASLPRLWQEKIQALPPPIDRILACLGPLLPEGGVALGRAIDETREELTGFIRTERQRQAAAQRVSGAVCLSGALLLILVLI